LHWKQEWKPVKGVLKWLVATLLIVRVRVGFEQPSHAQNFCRSPKIPSIYFGGQIQPDYYIPW
jgi:hypothetical protein